MAPPNGSRPSRAIENSIRMHAVCTARQQTVIAMPEQARKTSPSPDPSVPLTMYGSPSVPAGWR
jgi:hypothetical protein